MKAKKVTRRNLKLRKKKTSRKTPYKVTIISGLVSSGACGLLTLFLNFGDWGKLGLWMGLGLFLGFLAAPEFEPKHFKFPVLWQTACGGLGGMMLALILKADPNYFMLSMFLGLILGATAKFWIMHFPGP